MNKKNTYVSIGVAVLLILAIWVMYFLNNKPQQVGMLDEFAKCLTEKGAVMYGTVSCSYCKAEKDSFGSSFQFIKYVECSEDTELCTNERIDGVPTWKIGGMVYEGLQGLQKLSELSSCPLPVSEK